MTDVLGAYGIVLRMIPERAQKMNDLDFPQLMLD